MKALKIRRTRSCVALAVSLTLLLSACNTTTPLREIFTDQEVYVSKHFSAQALAPEVRKALPPLPAGTVPPRRLRFENESVSEKSDGTIEKPVITTYTYTHLGDGLFRFQVQSAANDVSYGGKFGMTHFALLTVKAQAALNKYENSGSMTELKQIYRFDPLPTKVGQQMVIEFPAAFRIQCEAIDFMPAKLIHPKLRGQALNLDCDFYRNNAVVNRAKRSYLIEYGFALMREQTFPTHKEVYTIKDVAED